MSDNIVLPDGQKIKCGSLMLMDNRMNFFNCFSKNANDLTQHMEVHPKFLKNFHNHSIYDVINFFEKYEYDAVDILGNKIEDYKKHLEQETTDSNRTVWLPKETI